MSSNERGQSILLSFLNVSPNKWVARTFMSYRMGAEVSGGKFGSENKINTTKDNKVASVIQMNRTKMIIISMIQRL